jgi:hypothetical protein
MRRACRAHQLINHLLGLDFAGPWDAAPETLRSLIAVPQRSPNYRSTFDLKMISPSSRRLGGIIARTG